MSEETKKVTLYQQKDQEGNPVAPLVPERGIYDENGVRLDDKLKIVNLKRVDDAIASGVETIKKEGDIQVAEVQKQLPTLKHQIGLDKYQKFNNSTNYQVGDVVLREDRLYKYKVAHEAGAWNYQEVYEVSMDQDLYEKLDDKKADKTDIDAELDKKANAADVTSQMQTEQTRVNEELAKKFNKSSIAQESGEAEDKVMSQKAVNDKLNDLDIYYKVSNFYKINRIIKEIYLTEDFFTEKNWEKVYVFKVQRNVNNTWLVVLSEDTSGTNSFALVSKSEETLLFNNYAYVILDWNYIEEGTEYYLKGDGYILSSHSKNISHAPGIYSKINDENIKSVDSITKENTSSIKELVHQFGINDKSNLFIKECYLTDKFFTDYGWEMLYCFSIRRNFNGLWQIIFSNDRVASNSFGFLFGYSGENYAENDYIKILVDWSQVPEGMSQHSNIAIETSKCRNKNLITMIGSESNKAYSTRTGTELYNYAKSVSRQPMFTWIDDDGVYSGIEKIRTVFETNSIPMTFAVIPPLNDIAHDDVTRLDYFKSLQLKGYHITSHPIHKYWYGDNYDITKVESSLISCLTELQSSGFLHSDMLVYPGSSGSNTQIVNFIKKWCCCGITAGFEKANHLGLNTKWNIKRCFIEFNAERTVTWYKQLIDDTSKKGDWLIFGTHSNGFNTSTETSDESANNIGNLNEVIAYAKSKGTFYNAWDAYNRRKPLFDAVEYNK